MLDGENSGRVLVLGAPDVVANIVVDGLTFQNGNVSGSKGGGLRIDTDGNVTVTMTNIINNYCSGPGGGAYIDGGNVVTVENTFIDGNEGNENGGGIFIDRGLGGGTVTANLTQNTITNNICVGRRRGGGVSIGDLIAINEINIKNNIISFNEGNEGGGAFIHGRNAFINNNEFNGNNGGRGGGFNWIGDLLFASANKIINNTGQGLSSIGGGANVQGSSITILNNLISHNSAQEDGGGLRIFTNGAEGKLFLINNSIANNSSNEQGGGIQVYLNDDNCVANIYNNIIFGNTATEGKDIWISNDANDNTIASPTNLYNNDFDLSANGVFAKIPFPIDPSNLNNVDPLFVDSENDDYHLTSDSLLIDKGNNLAPELPSKDKDGKPRIIDGNYDNIAYVDIGAYEFGSPRGDLDGDGDVDGEDLRIFAESYGTYVGSQF